MSMLLILLTLFLSVPAMAYLDPATGSMIISAIVGLLATCALALKTYWYKLVRLFKKNQQPTVQEEKQTTQSGDTPEQTDSSQHSSK